MKNAFIYKNNRRKYILKRKKRLLLKKKYKLLLKKKIVKGFFFLKKKNSKFLKIFNNLKTFFLFNIYIIKYYSSIFFFKYNIIKNFWVLFIMLYNLNIDEIIKERIYLLFHSFSFNNIIKFIFLKLKRKKNKIKNKFYFKNIFFKKFYFLKNFKKNKFNYIIIKNLKKKKKKFLKIKIFINKLFKYKKKNSINIKIKMPFIFFNKYKKNMSFLFINYINKLLKLKIKRRNAFLRYWIRFYIYMTKHLFSNLEYILKRNLNNLYKYFKNFYLLVNFKKLKKKDKGLFFFNFFINEKKYAFLRRCKVPLYLYNFIQLLTNSFYKKNYFNIIYFFYKKKINIFKFNRYIKNLNNFIKIKFLIFFKNFIFIFILQYIIYWFNYYLLINRYKLNIYNYKKIEYLNKELIFIKKNKRWNNFLFLKYIYFFYNNIIK